MTDKEVWDITHAVWKWAWYKKYRVKTETWPFKHGKVVRIELVAKHRIRDFG